MVSKDKQLPPTTALIEEWDQGKVQIKIGTGRCVVDSRDVDIFYSDNNERSYRLRSKAKILGVATAAHSLAPALVSIPESFRKRYEEALEKERNLSPIALAVRIATSKIRSMAPGNARSK